jgi:hypothetical protein
MRIGGASQQPVVILLRQPGRCLPLTRPAGDWSSGTDVPQFQNPHAFLDTNILFERRKSHNALADYQLYVLGAERTIVGDNIDNRQSVDFELVSQRSHNFSPRNCFIFFQRVMLESS